MSKNNEKNITSQENLEIKEKFNALLKTILRYINKKIVIPSNQAFSIDRIVNDDKDENPNALKMLDIAIEDLQNAKIIEKCQLAVGVPLSKDD